MGRGQPIVNFQEIFDELAEDRFRSNLLGRNRINAMEELMAFLMENDPK